MLYLVISSIGLGGIQGVQLNQLQENRLEEQLFLIQFVTLNPIPILFFL